MAEKLSDQENLRKLLFHLVKKTKMDMEKQFLDCGIGITPFQYAILVLLNSDPSTLNDLARGLVIQPPSLVPPVDHLETLGFLERNADTQDRRKIQLSLTTKGKAILKEKLFDGGDDKLNTAFGKFGKSEQKQLLSLLNELNDNLN